MRLHSAIGYLTPANKLNGLEKLACDDRDGKLEARVLAALPLAKQHAREVA